MTTMRHVATVLALVAVVAALDPASHDAPSASRRSFATERRLNAGPPPSPRGPPGHFFERGAPVSNRRNPIGPVRRQRPHSLPAPPYAVQMEPLVQYSQRDPLYHQQKDKQGEKTANDIQEVKKSESAPKTSQVSDKDYKVEPAKDAEVAATDLFPRSPVFLTPDRPLYQEPAESYQNQYYLNHNEHPHYDDPEPIIEIIVQESNQPAPTHPPQPVLPQPPPTKEPVQVFYVKYKKNPDAYGKEGSIVYDKPIPAVTPASNNHDDVYPTQPPPLPPVELATPHTPVRTTTLRAIIKPDSETFHGAGLHVTFGEPHQDVAESDGESVQYSEPQPAVSFAKPVVAQQRQGSAPPFPGHQFQNQPPKRHPEGFHSGPPPHSFQQQPPQPFQPQNNHVTFPRSNSHPQPPFHHPRQSPFAQAPPPFRPLPTHQPFQQFNNQRPQFHQRPPFQPQPPPPSSPPQSPRHQQFQQPPPHFNQRPPFQQQPPQPFQPPPGHPQHQRPNFSPILPTPSEPPRQPPFQQPPSFPNHNDNQLRNNHLQQQQQKQHHNQNQQQQHHVQQQHQLQQQQQQQYIQNQQNIQQQRQQQQQQQHQQQQQQQQQQQKPLFQQPYQIIKAGEPVLELHQTEVVPNGQQQPEQSRVVQSQQQHNFNQQQLQQQSSQPQPQLQQQPQFQQQRHQQQQQLQQQQQQQQQPQQQQQHQQQQRPNQIHLQQQQQHQSPQQQQHRLLEQDLLIANHQIQQEQIHQTLQQPQSHQQSQQSREQQQQFQQHLQKQQQSPLQPQLPKAQSPYQQPLFRPEPTSPFKFLQPIKSSYSTKPPTVFTSFSPTSPFPTTPAFVTSTTTSRPIVVTETQTEENTKDKEAKIASSLAALPDEVPDDIRQQLLASGILGNADIQILDYDKVGDIPIDKLPPHALENFYGAGSAPVPSVLKANIPKVEVTTTPKPPPVEMKVVRYDPSTKEGQNVADQYVRDDATQVDPVVLNDSRYNRYLPLQVVGSHFPVPDVAELRGRNVTSVVVLAPVDYDFLQRTEKDEHSNSDLDRLGRSAPVEVQGVRFVAGEILKELVKNPTMDNYKLWLQQERNTPSERQSIVLLVTSPPPGSNTTKEIFMYDVATKTVSKLRGELSSAFVDVAEANASSQDLDNISLSMHNDDPAPAASEHFEQRVPFDDLTSSASENQPSFVDLPSAVDDLEMAASDLQKVETPLTRVSITTSYSKTTG